MFPLFFTRQRRMMFLIVAVVFASFFSFHLQVANAATYTVTTNADAGAGSFRQAITDANANAGTDLIDFDAGLSGATITLLSDLDTITEAVVIDGSMLLLPVTLSGKPIRYFAGGAGSILKGVALSGSDTFCLEADQTTGLVIGGIADSELVTIDGCTGHGIALSGTVDTVIYHTQIGVNTGVAGSGIVIGGGSGVIVGGSGANERNVIVQSASYGIEITSSLNAVIQGNYIGTVTGDDDWGNGAHGIMIDGSTDGVQIGGAGAGEGNVISGNAGIGIVSSVDTANSVVQGNHIGVNADGDADLGNDSTGIYSIVPIEIGGDAAGEGNVISGNGSRGIWLESAADGSVIQGNYVGVNAVGDAAIGNAGEGMLIFGNNNVIGGATVAKRNIISGNGGGIFLSNAGDATANNNQIYGNYIGTNAAGDAAIPNTGDGIFIDGNANDNLIGGSAVGEGNLISGNTQWGIHTWNSNQSGTIIQGNYIGTNAAGDAALPNGSGGVVTNNDALIGGTNAGEGNLISGNTANGVQLGSGNPSTVQGNYIGVNAAGDAALPNGLHGVQIEAVNGALIGGATADARNIISGNTADGILIDGGFGNGDNTVIKNNYIGTNAAGDTAVPNGVSGIELLNTVDGTQIGLAGQGNLIAGNTLDGLGIFAVSTGTVIAGNYFGTNAAGDALLANARNTILIQNSDETIVGGSGVGDGNVLSGAAGGYGVVVDGGDDTQILGNYIGTNAAGDAAIPNAVDGISLDDADGTIIGGSTANERNVISGNARWGILTIDSSVTNTLIQGNYIGLTADGTAALGNASGGVGLNSSATVGGSAVGEGNVISGNIGDGINMADITSVIDIEGNYIGLNAAGTAAVPNTASGVVLYSSNSFVGGETVASRNVISGNAGHGIYVSGGLGGGDDNLIENNYIGVNAAGDTAIANGSNGIFVIGDAINDATGNQIGVAGFGNVVSGNTQKGILLEGVGVIDNSIQANIVGLGADGSTAIGNGSYGVALSTNTGNTIGTANDPTSRNIISGNADSGIFLVLANSNTIVNNYIGLASDGTTQRFNGNYGIALQDTSASNVIGGTAVGAGNTLAVDDPFSCIFLTANAGDFNAIRHNNCLTESAIAFHITLEDGVPNEGVDTPVINPETATTSRVGGTSIANGAIDLFVNGLYVGSTTADGAGDWEKNMAFVAGGLISASATNTSSSTSATSSPQVIIILDITDPSAPIIVTPASGGSINIEMVTLTGTKEAYTSIWIGDTEEVVNDELTTWTITDYPIDPGLNTLSVTAEDYSDNASEALIFTITYNPLTMELTIDQQTVEEDSEASIVTIQLSGVYPLDVTIPYVITGTAVGGGVDYVLADGDFVVADGDTEAIITFTIIDDDDKEDDETIIITLGDPDYGTLADVTVQTITIDHNDRGGSAIYFAPVDDPELAITTPTSGTAVNSGQRLQIRWTTQGPITYVNIQFSDSNGSAWTTVTTVSNSRSSTITVPETSASTAYLRLQGTDLETVSTTSNQVRLAMNGAIDEPNDTTDTDTTNGGASGDGSNEEESSSGGFTAGDLIKLADDGRSETQMDSTVYIIGADNKRHVFPNPKVYFSWYANFDDVQIISASHMSDIALGHNITYHPGVVMIKFQASLDVYAVSRYGVLHWVPTEALASAYYGSAWNTHVDDVSDAFFFNYMIGEPIEDVLDYNPEGEQLGVENPIYNLY